MITNSMIKRAIVKRFSVKGEARDRWVKHINYINYAFDEMVYGASKMPLLTSSAVRMLKLVLDLPYVKNNPKYNQIVSMVNAINRLLYDVYGITKKYAPNDPYWHISDVNYAVDSKIRKATEMFRNQLIPLIG